MSGTGVLDVRDPEAPTSAAGGVSEGGVRWARLRATLFLAWRNLTGERRRWVISAGALGVASMLVLFMQGTARWVTTSATAYVAHTNADLVVAQRGVGNLIFAQSQFPARTVNSVRRIPGVASVTPLVTVNSTVSVGGSTLPIFIVGYPGGTDGGPWAMSAGSASPSGNQAVVDRGLASIGGVRVGDSVSLLGHSFRVTGLSAQTDAAGDFFVFVPVGVLQPLTTPNALSYGLVRLAPGASATQVETSVGRLGAVHAMTRQALVDSDSAMIQASFAQPVEVLVVVGLIVGVLIAAIVLYTATVEHSRDYAVLKAIGASSRTLYGVTVVQSVILSAIGLLIGWGLAAAIATALDRWRPVVESQLDLDIVGIVAGLILATNLLAALLPIRYVMRVDPQEVFKA